MSKKNQHVVPSNSGGWAVRRTGAERASKVFENQTDAVKHARSIAKKEKSELYVHRKDGTVREKDSYGNDPRPSKSKK